MEAILGVALAIVSGVGIVAVVVLALKNGSRADQLLAARGVIDGYIKQLDQVVGERDSFKEQRDANTAQLKAALERLAGVEKQRNESTDERAARESEVLAAAPAEQVGAALDETLSRPLSR